LNFLLDVNVLIALIDSSHVSHEAAHHWFGREGRKHWATCPITQNGFVRIVGNPRYPNSPGSPGAAAALIGRFARLPGHVFWPDDVSLLDSALFDAEKLLTPAQVTDSYLLGLAVSKSGMLATLDRRLSVLAARQGGAALHIIEGVA
jgi:toxin-antitoxin system PIN domain toxin